MTRSKGRIKGSTNDSGGGSGPDGSGEEAGYQAIVDRLAELYPEAACTLDFSNAYQLLVATVLAAQCTDERVNKVTRDLFVKYPTPEALAMADREELEEDIHELGFFRNKSKNLIAAATAIVEEHGGEVPASREELTELPGVGRKTANAVLANAFDTPAFAVDTHVQRVSNRLGLASSDKVRETEEQLTRRIARERWVDTHHRLIRHGRQVCAARRPACEDCGLREMCREYGEDA